jgi:very-short-patch-repair endonuclease
MATKKLMCANCAEFFEIRVAEYNRQARNGRDKFYCSRSCGAQASNARKKKPAVEKICPVCGNTFTTVTNKNERSFCSRSCASAGSVTPARRAASAKIGNNNLSRDIHTTAVGLRRREAWKYKELAEFLEYSDEPYEFEHVVGVGIFDLALPSRNLLVEFDGRYHNAVKQAERDLQKTASAEDEGWTVIRVPTDTNVVIPPSVLYKLLR